MTGSGGGVEVIDAQVHVWPPETDDRPWIPSAGTFTHGDEYSYERLIAEMDEAGVHGAILVPPSFEGDRNDYCLAATEAYPERFAVMGRLPVADPASRGLLRTWRDQKGMLGVRLTFSLGEARNWLHDGTADWLWSEAEDAGVPLMVWVPGQVEQIAAVAARHPDLRLAIDHLALGVKLRNDELDPALDEVLKLARFPNVAVKATCLPSYVTDPWPFKSLHTRVQRVVDAFGPQRVFWGSDLSRLIHATYRQTRTLFMEELDFLSDDDLAWIMGRGIRQWLDWSTPTTT